MFILLCRAISVPAQENIPLGTWRTHLTYRNVKTIAVAGERIFAATDNSFFFFDKEDHSTTKLTRADGFSDLNISTLGYYPEKDLLLIAYANGGIDVLRGNEITNFDLIKRTSIRGSKAVNQITFYGDMAFLSADFGVVVIDLNALAIIESYLNIGEGGSEARINGSTIVRDSIFLATDQGVMAAPLNKGLNLQDFNSWRRFGEEEGIAGQEVLCIEAYGQSLYSGTRENLLYTYEDGLWSTIDMPVAGMFYSLKASGESLYIATADQLLQLKGNQMTKVAHPLIREPRMAEVDGEGNIWVADLSNGLLSDYEGDFNNYFPAGPFSGNTFDLYAANGKVVAVSGGYDEDFNPYHRKDGFYVFEKGAWTNYNETGIGNAIPMPPVEDLVDMARNPRTGNFIFASYEDGLLIWDGRDQFTRPDKNAPEDVKITALAMDHEEGLWVTSQGAPSVLHRLFEGKWSAYSFGQGLVPTDIAITQRGVKWITLESGILVVDEKGDNWRVLSDAPGEGGLPSRTVNTLAIDREGRIWVGTEEGIAFFTNPGAVFSEDFRDVSLPVYQNRFLFRNEPISAIAIDGGNRKWIGSHTGLWLFGADGDTLIYNFTTKNSPLPDNRILDIAIEENTGEVFVNTAKGLVSFRGTSTRGSERHQNVKIFPNPVTRDFTGLVGISGLATDAIVKITDVSGNLVREFRAAGGTATWDVANIYGERVSTGVYLVFSATDDGEETFIGKIGVVN